MATHFEKMMEIAERADKGEANENEMKKLINWLDDPAFLNALVVVR